MEAIEQAIMHGARAGKLRAFVRQNGSGLRGLERLADRDSQAATAALERLANGAARRDAGFASLGFGCEEG